VNSCLFNVVVHIVTILYLYGEEHIIYELVYTEISTADHCSPAVYIVGHDCLDVEILGSNPA
jgi:hypothetical protein